MWGIMISLFGFGILVMLGTGVALFQAGALTLGTMYLLYQYLQMLKDPLDQITQELRELQKAGAGVGRVQTLFDTPVEIKDGPGAHFPEGALSVDFDGVSFGYGDEEMVLRDIDFELAPGGCSVCWGEPAVARPPSRDYFSGCTTRQRASSGWW